MNDKVHLLLIDDEKNYLLVLETLLTEAGYAVTALNDPETALAFLEESEVDIVITDMKMPRISGREVLERVKKNWPHIPVLIMTAFGSIESAVEAMRYGAFNYITKPFSNDELLLSIQNPPSWPAPTANTSCCGKALKSATASTRSSGAAGPSVTCSPLWTAPGRAAPRCSSPANPAPARNSSRAPSTFPRRAARNLLFP